MERRLEQNTFSRENLGGVKGDGSSETENQGKAAEKSVSEE
jgi:hypothetical protein